MSAPRADGRADGAWITAVQRGEPVTLLGRRYVLDGDQKPDEPTGLGAVVEDADGWRWVRVVHPDGLGWRWYHGIHHGIHYWRTYAEVQVVRVLSPGVAS